MSDFSAVTAEAWMKPMPRVITENEGTTELSQDVRLVTTHVLPMQRKAMRGIFADAGIRVVANKKKFVIEVFVKPAEELDLSEVPEDSRDGYFEVHIQDNTVQIISCSQEGALWGSHAFAAIYKSLCEKFTIVPNMTVRDWPIFKNRGLVLGMGSDLAEKALDEVKTIVNISADNRLNMIGVPLFVKSKSGDGYDPICALPEEKSELKLKSSPYDEESMPHTLYRREIFLAFYSHAMEKGVNFTSVIDVFGGTCPFKKWMPELFDGDMFDLGNEDLYTVLSAYFAGMKETCFPVGLQATHLVLDDLASGNAVDADADKAEAHIARLMDILRENRVKKFIIWNKSGNFSALAEKLASAEDVVVMNNSADVREVSVCCDSEKEFMILEAFAESDKLTEQLPALGESLWLG